jgi:hypothetical protein
MAIPSDILLPAAHLALGQYRHYKGQRYEVLHTAQHSETNEILVIYRCLYGDFSIWARPLEMFIEPIRWPDGQMRPRFCIVTDHSVNESDDCTDETARL